MTEALVYLYTDQLHYCPPPPLFTDDGARWLPTGTTWTCPECGRRHVVAYIETVGTRWMTTDPPQPRPPGKEAPTSIAA